MYYLSKKKNIFSYSFSKIHDFYSLDVQKKEKDIFNHSQFFFKKRHSITKHRIRMYSHTIKINHTKWIDDEFLMIDKKKSF